MLQTPPSVPLWFKILKVVIGPVVAAFFVVVGLIWRDWIERRNVAQDWFEETYITEGMDVIISHLAVLCHFANETRRVIYSETKVPPLSSSVSRKLFTFSLLDFLAGVETAEAVILCAMRKNHPIKLSQGDYQEVLMHCVALTVYADTVRFYLLKTKIRSKADVYAIERNPEFLKMEKKLNDVFLESGDLPTVNRVLMVKFGPRIADAARAMEEGAVISPPSDSPQLIDRTRQTYRARDLRGALLLLYYRQQILIFTLRAASQTRELGD